MAQDLVNPKHYNETGPLVNVPVDDIEDGSGDWVTYRIKAIDVFRAMRDPRLATAFKYIWRVAFGGKKIEGDVRTQEQIDKRDLESAIWYLQDYINHPPENQSV